MTGRSLAATARLARRGARHERRRTVFVVVLIAIPVAVAVVVGALVGLTSSDPAEQAFARMGHADLVIEAHLGEAFAQAPGVGLEEARELDRLVTDPEVSAEIADATRLQQAFVAHRYASSDGVVSGNIEVSDLEPDSPLVDGMLELATGRWPEAGEVAVTRELAAAEDLDLGDTFRLDDSAPEATVVGLLVDPRRLDTLAAVTAPGSLPALLPDDVVVRTSWLVATHDVGAASRAISTRTEARRPPAADEVPTDLRDALAAAGVESDTVERLTDGDVDRLGAALDAGSFDDLQWMADDLAWGGVVDVTTRADLLAWQPGVAERPATWATLVAAGLLVEVALIAGAAYAAGIRRRLREIGLLSAQGADEGQVRAIVVGEAIVAGVVGAALGVAIGLGAILAVRDLLEHVTHVPVVGLPVGLASVLAPALTGVLAATVAAWLPAHTAARVPTLTALQGRMPESAPRAWVAPLGVALGAIGVVLVVVGQASASTAAIVVAGSGVVLLIAGAALLAGPLVALLGRAADRLPPVSRMVVRDAARQRTRAAAAVAASMIVLVGPVVAAATIERQEAVTAIRGLTADGRQVLLTAYDASDRAGEPVMPEQVVDDVVAALTGARRAHLTSYDAALWGTEAGMQGPLGATVGNGVLLATPEVADLLGDDVADLVAERTPVLLGTTMRTRAVVVVPTMEDEPTTGSPAVEETIEVTEVPAPVIGTFPRLLLDTATIDRLGLAPVAQPMALVVAEEPVTGAQADAIRDAAVGWADADVGVGFDLVDPTAMSSRDALLVGLAATVAVLLVVVGMVTSLAAAESRDELRLVTAVGAPPGMRRRFLGLQTGVHVALGAILAVPLGLLLYWVGSTDQQYVVTSLFGRYDGASLDVPWLAVAVLVVGLPVVLGLVTAATVRSSPTVPPRRIA